MVYFDRVATALIAPEAVKAITEFLKVPVGNPSAHIHSAGITAAGYIDDARHKVAGLINAKDDEVYFTSGATESNNLAIKGYLSGKNEGEIIISEIEHYSVLDQVKTLSSSGFNVKLLKVDRFGRVNPDDLDKLITPKTVLVSVMMANPEIGTIQPIKELMQVCKKKGIVFHTDASSAAGYVPIDVDELDVNMMTISAQTLGGPMGVGALYIDKKTLLGPIFDGGNQEHGYRPGTENVAGIVGFGAACEAVKKRLINESAKLKELGKKLWRGLQEKVEHIEFTGHPELRLPGHVSFWHKFIEGESLLLHLNLKKVMAASGSACSSNLKGEDEHDLRASHVLSAVGVPEEYCSGSITFSLDYHNTIGEVEYVLDIFPGIVHRLEGMSPVYADYIKKREKNE
jgi:cysteine desulfurase